MSHDPPAFEITPHRGKRSRTWHATRRNVRRTSADRRGFSMILVMLAMGFALALTYGFMRTQVTSLQLTQNEIRRDLALEAARTGAAAGLLRMQDPSWVGVTDTYSKITQLDSGNKVTCDVSYSAPAAGQLAGVADASLPLHVILTSIGTWSSPRDSSITVKRTITVVVRLMPRLPGRTARDGDVATATDLATNPTNYQATLPYSLTMTSSSSTSLRLDPGARIEGPVWLRGMVLFDEPRWSSTIRNAMLTEIGNQYGSTSPSTFAHPHPLNGPVRFRNSPNGSTQTDMSRLKTPWSTNSESPTVATVNASAWMTYQLYDKGPVYQATTLSSSLSNVTLRPSASNPLGIFVRSGNLEIRNSVSVQGTLVVSGTITFQGHESVVTAYNWIDVDGNPANAGAEKWPRLPAVVAKEMQVSDSARQVIEGAVVIDNKLTGEGADFSYLASNWVNITGTATATRGQQPYSTVQLQGTPDLTALTGNQEYAIWLSAGTTGRWYPIQSMNVSSQTLTVVGEVATSQPVSFRIRSNLDRFASLHGPVVAGTATIESQPMWDVTSSIWSNTHADWNQTNVYLQSIGQPRITFPDWLTNPANLINQGWYIPWRTAIYGLQLEPTFSIQPMPNVGYLAKPPLFKPYTTSGSDSAAAGYRWKIVDWREDL